MKLRHIKVQSEEEANVVLEELNGGSSFVDLVKKHSVSAELEEEGMVGLLRSDEFKRIFGTGDETG